jgi:hypothetical protein
MVKFTLMARNFKPLGMLAIGFTFLFNAGLCFVSAFGYFFGVKPPYFPEPMAPAASVVGYFSAHSSNVLMASFLQFGAAVLLGVFAVMLVAHLRAFGATRLLTGLALFGGLMTSFDMSASNLVLWVLAQPGVSSDPVISRVLHRLSFAFGGPGFSVTIGILFLASSVGASMLQLLPKWVVRLGIVVGSFGLLSWFTLIMIPMTVYQAVVLIPLTRFPGFVWLIAVGFKLPRASFKPAKPTARSG